MFVIVIEILLCLIACVISEFIPFRRTIDLTDFNCEEAGFHHSALCSDTFVTCVGATPLKTRCHIPGKVFHAPTKQCVSSYNDGNFSIAECKPKRDNKRCNSEGNYLVPVGTCSPFYWQCVSGTLVGPWECREYNWYFDPFQRKCVPLFNSFCAQGPDFTCDGKSETLLHAIGPCSQRYHGCHRGIANEMLCPNNTVFFPLRQRCVPRSQSEWCFAQKYAERIGHVMPMKLFGTFHTYSSSSLSLKPLQLVPLIVLLYSKLSLTTRSAFY